MATKNDFKKNLEEILNDYNLKVKDLTYLVINHDYSCYYKNHLSLIDTIDMKYIIPLIPNGSGTRRTLGFWNHNYLPVNSMWIEECEVINISGHSLKYRKKGDHAIRKTNSCSSYYEFSELIGEILEDR